METVREYLVTQNLCIVDELMSNKDIIKALEDGAQAQFEKAKLEVARIRQVVSRVRQIMFYQDEQKYLKAKESLEDLAFSKECVRREDEELGETE